MGETINLLTAVSDATASNNFQLLPLCDPGTGESGKMTIAQAKTVFAPYRKKYIALGTEGTTLVISELSGKEILMATRESGVIYQTTSAPDPVEFTFDGTTITLGLALTIAGERLSFIFKTPA